MKTQIVTALALLLSLPCFSQAVSPTVINSAGGSSRNGYYQFEWSVGEMSLTNTGQSADGLYVVTNGFLQPYVNTPASFDKEHVFSGDELHIFPIPAGKYVEIDFSTRQQGKVWFTLYNSIGQKVYDRTFSSYGLDHIERIDLDKLAAGTYLLYIQLDPIVGSYIKRGVFKIVKGD